MDAAGPGAPSEQPKRTSVRRSGWRRAAHPRVHACTTGGTSDQRLTTTSGSGSGSPSKSGDASRSIEGLPIVPQPSRAQGDRRSSLPPTVVPRAPPRRVRTSPDVVWRSRCRRGHVHVEVVPEAQLLPVSTAVGIVAPQGVGADRHPHAGAVNDTDGLERAARQLYDLAQRRGACAAYAFQIVG
jgi:hypothetical protein